MGKKIKGSYILLVSFMLLLYLLFWTKNGEVHEPLFWYVVLWGVYGVFLIVEKKESKPKEQTSGWKERVLFFLEKIRRTLRSKGLLLLIMIWIYNFLEYYITMFKVENKPLIEDKIIIVVDDLERCSKECIDANVIKLR